jgi:hypothetical protein
MIGVPSDEAEVACGLAEPGGSMSRDIDWHVFDKAADVTASAVRGAMGLQGSQPASYVAEVFREIYTALREATDEMPSKDTNTGF